MKSLWLLVACFLMIALPVKADLLVLKNGKVIKTHGKYDVKGQFVVFRMAEDGPLTQLPLRAVDLDRSAEATQRQKQKEAERQAQLAAPPPEPPKDKTLSELADYVEETKDDKNAPPPVIRLGNEKLQDFTKKNPPPTNEEAAWVPPSDDTATVEGFNEKAADFRKAYQALKTKLDEVNNNIEATEQSLIAAEQNSAFGDDPTGNYYTLMERFEKQLEELRKTKADIEKQMQQLDREARQAGIPGYKRYQIEPNR